jgi:hypothetical protein
MVQSDGFALTLGFLYNEKTTWQFQIDPTPSSEIESDISRLAEIFSLEMR